MKEPPSAWQKTLKLLNRRALSTRQLSEKLHQAGFLSQEVREAVEKAEKLGFINDKLLAEDCAKYAAASGLGRYRIKQKLQTRGLNTATVAQAVEGTFEDETARARECFEKKLNALSREPDWRKRREKVFRHLVSRGFPMSLAGELSREIKDEKNTT